MGAEEGMAKTFSWGFCSACPDPKMMPTDEIWLEVMHAARVAQGSSLAGCLQPVTNFSNVECLSLPADSAKLAMDCACDQRLGHPFGKMASFVGAMERSCDGKETDCSWPVEGSFSVFHWKGCVSNAAERFSFEVTHSVLQRSAYHSQVPEVGFVETWAGDCEMQNGFCVTSF